MPTSLVSAANSIARFFIEIVAVVALGICVGPLVAVAAIVAWGLFAAPKARFRVEVLRLARRPSCCSAPPSRSAVRSGSRSACSSRSTRG